ncbi:hypothetical protein F511_02175 [Dorcoceras hygrometricum]|uniref:MADS-box domain-containing protein n=1 Tax=Dorcoceras hygrometricum TaxID=472368 RepID=A0A2Z7ANB8_9LAMI|nr:hypothetical protein F511_02175 [Dorcoceras hygrometricum]
MSTSGNNNGEDQTRKGKGRRKVAMEKMENESNLQVTFSKRRNGLFKKASELSTRCGSEPAVVVFSPTGKPYSFGHPSVQSVTSRFVGQNEQNPQPTAVQLLASEAERNMISNATAELNQAMDQLELTKNQAKDLDRICRQVPKIAQMREANNQQLAVLKREVLVWRNKFNPGAPSTFLGSNPNPGTTVVEPTGTCSFFDPPVGSNQQDGFSNQLYDPRFAGTSTSINFGEVSMWGDAGSGFVTPYPPLPIDPAATIPMDPIHRNDAAGSSHKDAERRV